VADKFITIGNETISLHDLIIKFGIGEKDFKQAMLRRCIECDAIAKVTETRKRKTGTHRRYQCTDPDCGTRFSSIDGNIQKETIQINGR